MESLVKLNSQTAGRDKIARLLQYLSRLLWYRLQQRNKYSVDIIRNLEYQLSTFRKLLRLGRCIDSLYSALLTFQHPNPTVRFAVVLSKINNALFLFADHILWLGRADVCSVNTERWSEISNKYWLYSITMNLVRDFYEIVQIIKAEKRQILPKGDNLNLSEVAKSCSRAILCIRHNRQDLMVDTIKNCCDIFIPLSALGHVKLSPGTIGLLGVVSSIAGLVALIDPACKLTPS